MIIYPVSQFSRDKFEIPVFFMTKIKIHDFPEFPGGYTNLSVKYKKACAGNLHVGMLMFGKS